MGWFRIAICRQAEHMLANDRYAMIYAIVFALLPCMSWLAVAIVALISLRNGWCSGGLLLIQLMSLSFLCIAYYVSFNMALIDVTLTFVPCYLAANILRFTASWRALAVFFFLQALTVVLVLQLFMPKFILAQYLYLQAVVSELKISDSLSSLFSLKEATNQIVVANYLLGIQVVGVVFSTLLSLICARAMQSQLFYPGGFRLEVLNFRADKIGLLLCIGLVIAVKLQSMLAVSLLPLALFYFLLAGLSLSLRLLVKSKLMHPMILLIASLFLLPFIMFPVYAILGLLDSVFNFRAYLLVSVDK